jgi:hypothetical protein
VVGTKRFISISMINLRDGSRPRRRRGVITAKAKAIKMIVMIVMAAAHHSPAKHSPAKQSRAGYAKLLKTKLSDSKQSNWVTVEMIVAHFLTKKGAANMSQNDDDMIYDEDLLIEAALTFAKKT